MSLVLLFRSQPYHHAIAFNTGQAWAHTVSMYSTQANDYLHLTEYNRALADENVKLKKELALYKQLYDSANYKNTGKKVLFKYNYRRAKVVSNSIHRLNNYIVIDKGTADSLSKGMAVISSSGIVGKVVACSEHFSSVVSVLHSGNLVSSKLKRQGVIGTLSWTGESPSTAVLKYIPRHIEVKKGDTVVTSGQNTVYPEGVPIGMVKEIRIKGEESEYTLVLNLFTDFYSLNYVYVLADALQEEKQLLEDKTVKNKDE